MSSGVYFSEDLARMIAGLLDPARNCGMSEAQLEGYTLALTSLARMVGAELESLHTCHAIIDRRILPLSITP
jgi:hypothetical protein